MKRTKMGSLFLSAHSLLMAHIFVVIISGDVQEEEEGETLNVRLGNPSRITVSGGFCGLLSVQLTNRARSEKVHVKFLLSLNFLSNIPIKIVPVGDKVRDAHTSLVVPFPAQFLKTYTRTTSIDFFACNFLLGIRRPPKHGGGAEPFLRKSN